MPIIRFHGVDSSNIISQTAKLQKDLSTIFSTTIDNITIELISSKFIDGAVILDSPYPMVEIVSFKRTKEIEHRAAKEIFNFLVTNGYAINGCDIFYNYLDEDGYFVMTR